MPRQINIEALQELVAEHADCDTGEGLAAGCTLLDELRDLLDGLTSPPSSAQTPSR